MIQGNIFVNCLLASVLLTTMRAVVEPQFSALKPGDTLPPITGQALSGEKINMYAEPGGDHRILILSFSREGGHDAQNWAQRLSKEFPSVIIYTAIFLESVPKLFRSMAISGIKRDMPLYMQARTFVLYQDESVWKQRLQVKSGGSAGVILLRKDSSIDWLTAGPFSDRLYQNLDARLMQYAH